MRYKEPKEMVELHKIREKITKEYAHKSIAKINRQLIERTKKLSNRLKLPQIKSPIFKQSSTK